MQLRFALLDRFMLLLAIDKPPPGRVMFHNYRSLYLFVLV